MKAIRRRNIAFAAFTGFGILLGVMLLVFGGATSELQAQIFLTSVMIASAISAGFWIRECRKMKIARLIAENPILHIRTAVVSDIPGEAAQPEDIENEDIENIEVFVSYFGILLDTKIIKFNQDGIRLKAVEIGDDFISFTYGTEKWMQNTRLLRAPIDPATMDEISERFRYETGITPTFVSGRKQ
ncbi:hypothetical protein [Phosphitispora fastidiosa]|uniref:hypothetical protein n=1 Tax=Phosphitispora fastidiosa TaxID=2837202 RepID=UPI001E4A9A26|nr:hypothetical protein [Phosphitispora fastidiosa]MBU7006566.1 hypothetical protein [Phosphitispora fastidiosa]